MNTFTGHVERAQAAIVAALEAAGCPIPGTPRHDPSRRYRFLITITAAVLTTREPRIEIATRRGTYLLTLKGGREVQVKKMPPPTELKRGVDYNVFFDDCLNMADSPADQHGSGRDQKSRGREMTAEKGSFFYAAAATKNPGGAK